MDCVFYSLHDFMVFTKTGTYIVMGASVLGLWGYFIFLTGRDEDSNEEHNSHASHH